MKKNLLKKMNKDTLIFTLLFSILIFGCARNTNTNPSNNDIYRKVDSLMSLMTIKEKIGQTIMYSGDWDVTGPVVSSNNMKLIRGGNLGAMLNVYSSKKTKELQKIAVEETRLGIPLLFGYDVIHGFRTIFPINLGHASSWDIEDIEMAVPLSPEETDKKRRAIFKHQSQKDRPLFPGTDKREFWQRADDRTRSTADTYDKLGLAEYEAMEAFVRWKELDT